MPQPPLALSGHRVHRAAPEGIGSLPGTPPRHGARWAAMGVMLGAIALSLYSAGIGRQALVNWAGFTQIGVFLQASLHPDLSGEFC
jgi:hypothetical protein